MIKTVDRIGSNKLEHEVTRCLARACCILEVEFLQTRRVGDGNIFEMSYRTEIVKLIAKSSILTEYDAIFHLRLQDWRCRVDDCDLRRVFPIGVP